MKKNVEDYNSEITTFSYSFLLEIMCILKGYINEMVLVGGWVPYLLLEKYNEDDNFKHVGSIDIDLVLDPKLINQGNYDSIVEILNKNGYVPRKDRLDNMIEFSFERAIKDKTIQIDFLSTNYPTRPRKRHRTVQPNLKARTLQGALIALEHYDHYELVGILPNKAEYEIDCRVANLVGSLTTKAIALGGRSVAKDYYDIYSLISYYKKGIESCVQEIKPHLHKKEITEAMGEVKMNFKSENSLGPTLIGNFMYPYDITAQQRVMTDSFMRINEFLKLIKI